MKRFPVLQQARLQFRAKMFSVLKNTRLQPPNISSGAGRFGKITSTLDPRILEFERKLAS